MGEPDRRRRRLRPAPGDPSREPGAAPPATATNAAPANADPSNAAASAAAAQGAAPVPGQLVNDRTGAVAGPPARPAPRPTSGAGAGARTPSGGAPWSGRPPGPAPERPTSGAGAGSDEATSERGLRGLVGSGSSQVSVGAAMRARDAARPTAEQLAEAEEHLLIVRRNWAPREDLPRR